VGYLTDLYRKGLTRFREFPHLPQTDTAHVLEFLVRNPQLFLKSGDNIALRETNARATNAPPSTKLLSKSRRSIERALATTR
jgi:hypothetical protein